MWAVQMVLAALGGLAAFSLAQQASGIPVGGLLYLWRAEAWPLLHQAWAIAAPPMALARPDWLALYAALAGLFGTVALTGSGRAWRRGALGVLGPPVWWLALPLLPAPDQRRFSAVMLLLAVVAVGGVAFAG